MGDARPHEVTVWRGHAIESRHTIHVAVVDADGELKWSAGDPSFMTFARSAVKAVQAIPLIEDGGAEHFAFSDEDIALTCASHSGEPKHVDIAADILRRIGASVEDLACGPHMPFNDEAADALRAAGQAPSRLHNNCSGKHAGMLALARHHGWPLAGYHELEHPVQQRMLSSMSQWSGIDKDGILTGVDGCGVVTFGLPLQALARIFARLSVASRRGEVAGARTVSAMVSHPDLVAGTGRMCTALMQATAGRVFAKVGAEGVYCAGIPGSELGIALKVEDGALRAAETGLLAVVRSLGALTDDDIAGLSRWIRPDVRNTRRETVGHVEANIALVGRT